jgi:hypothetical protein
MAITKLGRELMNKYDPPYSHKQIAANYGDSVAKRLMADEAHAWRADSGIELVHREPTRSELERIYSNWLLMPKRLRKISDRKSVELFGKDNASHYRELVGLY